MTYEEKSKMILMFMHIQEKFNRVEEKVSEYWNVQALNNISCYFKYVKEVVGMPREEKEGEWISDYWLSLFVKACEGEADKRKVIHELINWKSKKF